MSTIAKILTVFFFVVSVCSAQEQKISGIDRTGGLTYAYDFNVDTTLVNFAPGTPGYGGDYVNVLMSGSLDINDRRSRMTRFSTCPTRRGGMLTGWGPVTTRDQYGDPTQFEWELITTPPPKGAYVEQFSVGRVVTPEPSTVLLVGCALLALVALQWRH